MTEILKRRYRFSGKVRKSRVRFACVSCQKCKVKCSRQQPCDHCVKTGNTCSYIEESFELTGDSSGSNTDITAAFSGHADRPETTIATTVTSPTDSSTSRAGRKFTTTTDFSFVDETEEGRKYTLGAGSWSADVPFNHNVSGIRQTLNDFSRMRQEKELDCARPSSKVDVEVLPTVKADPARGSSMAPQVGNSIGAILGQSSSEFSDYMDPLANGMNQFLVRNLLDTYYIAVHPFNNILDWPRFTSRVFGSESSLPSTALLESSMIHITGARNLSTCGPLLAGTIWMVMALGLRALPTDHDIVVNTKKNLEEGRLNPLHSEFAQQDPRYVVEPSEYFLAMAERCMAAANLLTSNDDVGSVKALLLYIYALHDGSTRTWGAWSLLGVVTSLVQSLGWDRPQKTETDDKILREKNYLFIVVCNLGQGLALDLGQYFSPFPKIRFVQKFANLTGETLNEHYELSKYCLGRITRQILDLIYFDYGGINTDEVEGGSLLEHSFVKLWSNIPEQLRFRTDGYVGQAREQTDSDNITVEFQRVILDTLLHFSRFIYYRPSLKSTRKDSTVRQDMALHSARCLLENQLRVVNDHRLLIFKDHFWKEIYCHVFQAAVVVALLLTNEKFCQNAPPEFQQVFQPLIDETVNLYYKFRAHTLCSSAKAHSVLCHILGRQSQVVKLQLSGSPPGLSPTMSFSNSTDTSNNILNEFSPQMRPNGIKAFSLSNERECLFHGIPDLGSEVFELDFFAGILGEESSFPVVLRSSPS